MTMLVIAIAITAAAITSLIIRDQMATRKQIEEQLNNLQRITNPTYSNRAGLPPKF